MMKPGYILAAANSAILIICAGSALAADSPPAALQPAGYAPVLEAQASGVQIYASVAQPGGGPMWVLEAPLARLTDDAGKTVAYHYAGPSWEAPDGSKVIRDKATPVASVPAPSAADIPWLLVKVDPDLAEGVLSRVGFVQRIATHGGLAPAAPPVRAHTRIGVPYTATYVFLAKAK
jgi:hypothetical protein